MAHDCFCGGEFGNMGVDITNDVVSVGLRNESPHPEIVVSFQK
jgi:hypothetical protein